MSILYIKQGHNGQVLFYDQNKGFGSVFCPNKRIKLCEKALYAILTEDMSKGKQAILVNY
ncbi:hypothetical protein M23134_03746 [Microscilla marina ATCC 23134]|uniref:Uncharacterized protein n=1 Tax=Microscilla marina ATCC 23134 TaxID=313606 RepID=A1ZPD9_MICM2|nr:hypothetical protein M23134_03746 [Microscilla marina ATCC 23134]